MGVLLFLGANYVELYMVIRNVQEFNHIFDIISFFN
jgi:hypothetical protein